MTHSPRLVNAGVKCDTAYCAVCEHSLRRRRPLHEPEGPWVAVWSRSPVCTGPPLVTR